MTRDEDRGWDAALRLFDAVSLALNYPLPPHVVRDLQVAQERYLTGLDNRLKTPPANHYPWNDAHSAGGQTPEANVLHFGLNAVCEHLAEITRELRALNDKETT